MERQKITSKDQLDNFYPVLVKIWHEVFTPIIGSNQVEYMLEHYQSKELIMQEIDADVNYYALVLDNQYVGYTAYKVTPDYLYLSKIYITSEYRNKGLMREVFAWFDELSEKYGVKQHLRVNQGNTQAISVYQYLGFVLLTEEITDIGDGYQMVDYVFEKE
ncbi:GNAT family N-acetyltransferase [Tetragenococcus koreensis]|uniref:GNAT family N-acetyltransferase n=1 Tax=Tetragenococcus koreensis TaxID=290335 RepID=UPI001F3BEA2B|nr:GNAT family N-acetyltransferase [Tetragenococcus koreensis]MCF1628152.1 GNAT family N-acetyltransferase [Tetragenococcus koreensis]MCF1633051.1 GNAT family N-acetyltransferase [Tetragenococcus koreensis]MDN6291091.1 GNAT family N-acetyltransferase [Tetragenococcus koreensis]MDN6345321.1 GNAT family N-acetyltransferase [Tetragenococcus koreensis]